MATKTKLPPRQLRPYEYANQFCYTGVVTDDGKYVIARCENGVPGYSVEVKNGEFSSFEKALEKAQELNRGIGLTKETAQVIVFSTMRKSADANYDRLVKLARDVVNAANESSNELDLDDAIGELETELQDLGEA